MQPLGLNQRGYAGETIDIRSVLQDDLQAARRYGWETESIAVTPELSLLALHRSDRQPSRRVYLSAGIHGDEPAGPVAIKQLLQDNCWPENAHLWICPCLNPTGFPLNRRGNAQGQDLNRDYRHLETPEVRAHVAWLARQPKFDLTLLLHEDWEARGFYVYELNPDRQPSLAEAMVEAVAAACPIDHSPVIEGRPAQGGIIRPDLDPASRPQWPEAFYLTQTKSRLSYTLEAPSDFPLATRAAALGAAVRAAVDLFCVRG